MKRLYLQALVMVLVAIISSACLEKPEESIEQVQPTPTFPPVDEVLDSYIHINKSIVERDGRCFVALSTSEIYSICNAQIVTTVDRSIDGEVIIHVHGVSFPEIGLMAMCPASAVIDLEGICDINKVHVSYGHFTIQKSQLGGT